MALKFWKWWNPSDINAVKLSAATRFDVIAGGKIIKASFQIKFEGSKTPRSVILSSGNRAQFKRDGDAEVIERWLGLRGFIVGAGGVSDE